MPRPEAKKSKPAGIVEVYLRHRFGWLFLALMLTLGAAPAVRTVMPNFPLEFMLALTLLAAIVSTVHERWFQLLLLLGVGFLITRGVQVLTGVQALLSVSQILWVLAVVLATATAARHAMRAGPVNAERIFAALDAYLLAGLIFAVCYWLIDQTWPGSFAPASEGPLTLPRAVYFSFVTIATLGYGDTVPVSDLARALAVLEAMSGQFYLVVLVARLVSLYARQDERPTARKR
jgi:hypothetical protein